MPIHSNIIRANFSNAIELVVGGKQGIIYSGSGSR